MRTTKKDWAERVFQSLAIGATVSAAAEAAGVGRTTVYQRLEADEKFRAGFENAVEQGTDVIEEAATSRAVVGVEEPVIYQGQVTFVGVDAQGKHCDPKSPLAIRHVPLTVRKPSDVLAIFLLKGRRPLKFRDNVKHEHVGADGGPIQATIDVRNVTDDELQTLKRITSNANRRAGAPEAAEFSSN